MKNKLSILSILGVCLLLAGCNNPSNSSSSGTQQSSSSQIENSSLETSSSNEETSTSKEDSSSEQTSSESSSSEVQSSESSSIVELTTLEKLKKYINDCVDGGNYTITDSEQTRRYLPNAYYCENLYDGNMGYAEDEKGVFSYEIVNGVVNARDYLKDDPRITKIGNILRKTSLDELTQIIDVIDIVSMDIKLQSATGQVNRNNVNEKFLKIASQKEVFIKVVFDKNIIQEEIKFSAELAKKYGVLLILQPKMPMDNDLELYEIYEKFYKLNREIRLIPQVHKFLNLA